MEHQKVNEVDELNAERTKLDISLSLSIDGNLHCPLANAVLIFLIADVGVLVEKYDEVSDFEVSVCWQSCLT